MMVSWPWITIPGETDEQPLLDVSMTIQLDELSLMLVLMTIVVTLLSSIVAWSAFSNMKLRLGFYSKIAFGLFATVLHLLSGNFLQLFLFWQLSVLSSAFLPGDTDRLQPAETLSASGKFLLTQWIADVPLLIGICLIWMNFGALGFTEVFSQSKIDAVIADNPHAMSGICVCLFLGVMGRCAQVPFYQWLSYTASSKPVVCGLIQCVTVMPAGIYLLVRCGPLFTSSPETEGLVLMVGGMTALLAAAMALAATDARRVLAFSSSSLFGLMIVGLADASRTDVAAPIQLLLTHSLAMTLLLLVIQTTTRDSTMSSFVSENSERSSARDTDTFQPSTIPSSMRWPLIVGCMVLATGFRGQNAVVSILWNRQEFITDYQQAITQMIVWPILLSLFLLAVAIFRFFFSTKTFFVTESHTDSMTNTGLLPSSSRIPLWILTLLSLGVGPLLSGLLFADSTPWFNQPLLRSKYGLAEPAVSPFAMGVGMLATSLGIVVAWMVYGVDESRARSERITKFPGPFSRLSRHEFYIHEYLHYLVVVPLIAVSKFFRFTNWLLDVFVRHAVIRIPGLLSGCLSSLQNGLVQFYALSLMLTAAVLLFVLLWLKV